MIYATTSAIYNICDKAPNPRTPDPHKDGEGKWYLNSVNISPVYMVDGRRDPQMAIVWTWVWSPATPVEVEVQTS